MHLTASFAIIAGQHNKRSLLGCWDETKNSHTPATHALLCRLLRSPGFPPPSPGLPTLPRSRGVAGFPPKGEREQLLSSPPLPWLISAWEELPSVDAATKICYMLWIRPGREFCFCRGVVWLRGTPPTRVDQPHHSANVQTAFPVVFL